MKRLVLLLLATVLIAAAPKTAVTVTDAWVREPNPARPLTAAFMTIENSGARDVALVGASSSAAKIVELHEMSMKDGMMTMRRVDRIAVPAKGRVQLAPGGLHLMMFDLTRELRDGDLVDLALKFDDGSTASVKAVVRAPEGAR